MSRVQFTTAYWGGGGEQPQAMLPLQIPRILAVGQLSGESASRHAPLCYHGAMRSQFVVVLPLCTVHFIQVCVG